MVRASWLNRTVLGTSIASYFSDFSHELVPLLLPSLLISIVGSHTAPLYVGIISGVMSAAAGFSMLFFGWYSDRLTKRKQLLLIGYTLSGLFVGLLGFAYHWFFVLICCTIAWIARGMISSPRNALITDSLQPEYYGRAFGFRQSLDTLGAISGPLFVYLVASNQPRLLFLSTFIPGILAIVAIYFLVAEHSHQPRIASFVKSLQTLPTQFYFFLAICLLFSLGNFNRTLLLLRIQETAQAPSFSTLTLLYVLRNCVQVISSYSIGALSDTVGRSIPLSLLGFGVFGVVSFMLIHPSTNLLFLILLFTLSGFSAGVYTTIEKARIADFLPKEERGTGFGLFQSVTGFGDLLASSIVSVLWQTISPEIAFGYAAVVSILSAILLLILVKKI